MLVGAGQALRENAIDVLEQRGTGADERQEICLRQRPERSVLLNAYSSGGRLARDQRHFAEALAGAEPGNDISALRMGLMGMNLLRWRRRACWHCVLTFL